MGNVVDYVRREFRGFGELAFSNVDSLVLSELSYMRLLGLVPAFGEAKSVATVPIRELLRAESYDGMFVSNSSEMNDYRLSLLRAVCESPRFRGLRVGEYAERLDESEQQQFAAMTFDLGADFGLYVAFRGTDGTLVGWKEDFNMSFCRVPSQLEAVHYLKAAALPGHRLVCAGHSKGGNLAVYAAAFSGKRLKNRIDSVYDFDGPGFIKEITADAQYLEIAPRIHKFVPQSSVIGRLLAAGEKSVAVMSDERGLRQHDLYSWRVVPPGEMERAESLNLEFVGNMLNDWISGMDIEERKSFFDTCYMVLSSSDAVTLSELSGRKSVMKILRTFKQTDPETRRLILRGLALLTRSVREHLPAALRRTPEQNGQTGQAEECAQACTCAAEEKDGAAGSTADKK